MELAVNVRNITKINQQLLHWNAISFSDQLASCFYLESLVPSSILILSRDQLIKWYPQWQIVDRSSTPPIYSMSEMYRMFSSPMSQVYSSNNSKTYSSTGQETHPDSILTTDTKSLTRSTRRAVSTTTIPRVSRSVCVCPSLKDHPQVPE